MHSNTTTSRWKELGDSIIFHAVLAHVACAPTKFIFINEYPGEFPGDAPISEILIDGGSGSETQLVKLQQILCGKTLHSTPLCASLKTVAAEINSFLPILKERNQGALLCIGSDGHPTDGKGRHVVAELEKFSNCKEVSVVIRLFTDEDKVVDFWNNVDVSLPALTIDVLDDLQSEAEQVSSKENNFIAYPLQLHRLREFGTDIPAMDMLDERKATPAEIRIVYHAL